MDKAANCRAIREILMEAHKGGVCWGATAAVTAVRRRHQDTVPTRHVYWPNTLILTGQPDSRRGVQAELPRYFVEVALGGAKFTIGFAKYPLGPGHGRRFLQGYNYSSKPGM